jgi:hypothetical protein
VVVLLVVCDGWLGLAGGLPVCLGRGGGGGGGAQALRERRRKKRCGDRRLSSADALQAVGTLGGSRVAVRIVGAVGGWVSVRALVRAKGERDFEESRVLERLPRFIRTQPPQQMVSKQYWELADSLQRRGVCVGAGARGAPQPSLFRGRSAPRGRCDARRALPRRAAARPRMGGAATTAAGPATRRRPLLRLAAA